MNDTIRWGIIGTGSIAHQFAQGLKVLDDAKLTAVTSRTQASADKFADEFGIKYRHVGVEQLTTNKDVDVVYVATPHPMHKDNTLQCLDGGKPVLCEKPFAMNVSEATEMIERAKQKNLFLMEAMWMYCFPAMGKVREIISSGAIGEVRQVHANLCFRGDPDEIRRLLDPDLGGGALLDVGVYTIALAQMVYQRQPSRIVSMAHLGETGTDEQSSMIFGYDDGAISVLTCAVRTNTSKGAAIYGTDGYIRIPDGFCEPDKIFVKVGQDPEQEFSFGRVGNGYNFEAAEVMDCLRKGQLQSDIVPHAETLAVMKTMDTIRKQWGLVYPMEK